MPDFYSQTLLQFSTYIPNLVGAFSFLVLGLIGAVIARKVVVKLLEALMLSRWLKDTPVDHFVRNADASQRIEHVVGAVVYWLLMLVVLYTSVSILGLAPLTLVLDRVLGYVPNIFKAVFVFFLGLLLSGVVEGMVKGSLKNVDSHGSRVMGRMASYAVVTLSVLIAISELGIARDYIMILFVGLVAMLALGFGLAMGLGGQDIVRQMLKDWHQRVKRESKE